MLTRRGWALVGGGLGLLALWAALGEIELLGAAVVVLGAVVFGVAMAVAGMPRAEVTRRLAPALVNEGDRALVRVGVSNQRSTSLRDLTLVDRVEGLGEATFEIATIPPRASVEASYHIDCRPRGVYTVGPVQLAVRDPLGLAFRTRTAGSPDRLIVYPETEALRGFPVVRGRDPATHASRPEFSHRGGEDFYTLREYRVGDDLRRVHWPSSAKRDEIMIRQLETPWQSRALVLLDVRPEVYESATTFEKAVRGAASVVRHLAASGFDAELWAGGSSTINVAQYATAMEALALVDTRHIDIRSVGAHLSRTGAGGLLFLITGTPDHDLLGVKQAMARDYPTVVVMSATKETTGEIAAFQRAGAVTMTASPTDSWAAVWMQATTRTWHVVSAV